MKKFLAAFVCILDLALSCTAPAPKHDYYLDVSKHGYSLHDATDDKKVATWKWEENPKLDNLIDSLNQ